MSTSTSSLLGEFPEYILMSESEEPPRKKLCSRDSSGDQKSRIQELARQIATLSDQSLQSIRLTLNQISQEVDKITSAVSFCGNDALFISQPDRPALLSDIKMAELKEKFSLVKGFEERHKLVDTLRQHLQVSERELHQLLVALNITPIKIERETEGTLYYLDFDCLDKDSATHDFPLYKMASRLHKGNNGVCINQFYHTFELATWEEAFRWLENSSAKNQDTWENSFAASVGLCCFFIGAVEGIIHATKCFEESFDVEKKRTLPEIMYEFFLNYPRQLYIEHRKSLKTQDHPFQLAVNFVKENRPFKDYQHDVEIGEIGELEDYVPFLAQWTHDLGIDLELYVTIDEDDLLDQPLTFYLDRIKKQNPHTSFELQSYRTSAKPGVPDDKLAKSAGYFTKATCAHAKTESENDNKNIVDFLTLRLGMSSRLERLRLDADILILKDGFFEALAPHSLLEHLIIDAGHFFTEITSCPSKILSVRKFTFLLGDCSLNFPFWASVFPNLERIKFHLKNYLSENTLLPLFCSEKIKKITLCHEIKYLHPGFEAKDLDISFLNNYNFNSSKNITNITFKGKTNLSDALYMSDPLKSFKQVKELTSRYPHLTVEMKNIEEIPEAKDMSDQKVSIDNLEFIRELTDMRWSLISTNGHLLATTREKKGNVLKR